MRVSMQPILLLLLPLLSAVEVKINDPNKQSEWHHGQTVTVRWDPQSLPTSLSQIDLDLVQDSADNLINNISFGVPVGEGSAEWVVPKKLAPGEYMVRVTSAENGGLRAVGEKFKVVGKGTKGMSSNPAAARPKPSHHNWSLYLYIGMMTLYLVV